MQKPCKKGKTSAQRSKDGPGRQNVLQVQRYQSATARGKNLSLLVLQQFGRGDDAAFHLFFALGAALVIDTDRGFQLLLALFLAPHVEQYLASQVVNVGAAGIEFVRRFNRA